jgi:hypothetical protein
MTKCIHCGEDYSIIDCAHVCSKGPYAIDVFPKRNKNWEVYVYEVEGEPRTVRFHIGYQYFELSYNADTMEEMMWMKEQLEGALRNVKND